VHEISGDRLEFLDFKPIKRIDHITTVKQMTLTFPTKRSFVTRKPMTVTGSISDKVKETLRNDPLRGLRQRKFNFTVACGARSAIAQPGHELLP